MVATLIVGIMFTGLYAGISQGMSVINSARQNLRATQIMADTMEVLRLYTWEQVNSNGFIPSTVYVPFFPDSTNSSSLRVKADITISDSGFRQPYSNNVKKITVDLSWTNSAGLQKRSMSTYVARNGLQNYVY